MRTSLLIPFVLLFSACGGGGGGTTVPPPPPPVDADPGGFWVGFVTYGDQTVEDLVGITTSAGRLTLISLDTFGPGDFDQYIGTLSVAGTAATGSGSAYAAPGTTWSNGATVVDFDLSATIAERSTITGSWTTSSGESGSFELDYDTEYERDSSLALMQGIWYVYDDMLNPELVLTVESGGAFTAQDNLGCQSVGQVSIIDAGANVYDWSVVISDCAIAGDYAGLAVMGDSDPPTSQNDIVLASLSNDLRALLLPLER